MQSPSTTLLPAEKRSIPVWRGVVIVLLAAGTVAACLWGSPPAKKSEPGVVMELPGSLTGLWGSDQPVSESEKVILPADTEFAKKIYSDGLGNDIHCQIVLAGAEKRSIHRPEVCLPAQGWTIKSGEVVPVKLADGKTLEVMKLTVVRPVAGGFCFRRQESGTNKRACGGRHRGVGATDHAGEVMRFEN